MKLLATAALATILLAGAAHAAGWTIDMAKSTLGFTGTQSGTAFPGHFTKYDAQIDFDPANPAAGHAVVTIDMASATTGDKQRDEAIPDADWFDTARFPQTRFEATGFKALGEDKYEADGTLSIRDAKKPVTLQFTFHPDGDTALVDATMPLARTDYGVGQGSWTTGDWVGLKVDVNLHLVAVKGK